MRLTGKSVTYVGGLPACFTMLSINILSASEWLKCELCFHDAFDDHHIFLIGENLCQGSLKA